MATEVFISVDISKPQLDVFNLATDEVLEFDNTPSGIQAFVKFAKKAKPTLLVCESTGGLEQPLLLSCSEAKLPLAVVNPRQVRDFSRRTGPVGGPPREVRSGPEGGQAPRGAVLPKTVPFRPKRRSWAKTA